MIAILASSTTSIRNLDQLISVKPKKYHHCSTNQQSNSNQRETELLESIILLCVGFIKFSKRYQREIENLNCTHIRFVSRSSSWQLNFSKCNQPTHIDISPGLFLSLHQRRRMRKPQVLYDKDIHKLMVSNFSTKKIYQNFRVILYIDFIDKFL